MKIDKPEHRDFLLQAISAVQIPGSAIDIAYEVKRSLIHAEVSAPLDTDALEKELKS